MFQSSGIGMMGYGLGVHRIAPYPMLGMALPMYGGYGGLGLGMMRGYGYYWIYYWMGYWIYYWKILTHTNTELPTESQQSLKSTLNLLTFSQEISIGIDIYLLKQYCNQNKYFVLSLLVICECINILWSRLDIKYA